MSPDTSCPIVVPPNIITRFCVQDTPLTRQRLFSKKILAQTASFTLARGWSVMSASRRKGDSKETDGSDEAQNSAATSVVRSTRRNSSEGGSGALSAIDMR